MADLFSYVGHSDSREIIEIMRDFKFGDKVFFQNIPRLQIKTREETHRMSSRLIAASRTTAKNYGFRVSIRTPKDNSGWLLIKLPLKEES